MEYSKKIIVEQKVQD